MGKLHANKYCSLSRPVRKPNVDFISVSEFTARPQPVSPATARLSLLRSRHGKGLHSTPSPRSVSTLVSLARQRRPRAGVAAADEACPSAAAPAAVACFKLLRACLRHSASRCLTHHAVPHCLPSLLRLSSHRRHRLSLCALRGQWQASKCACVCLAET